MKKYITGRKIFTGEKILTGFAIVIEGQRILNLIRSESIPTGSDVIDYKNYNISPGFIDLQIAGGGGYLFSSNLSQETLRSISKAIMKTGTTTMLIVLPTNSPEVYRRAADVLKSGKVTGVAGLHFEGPFISHEKRGAHTVKYIRKPDSGNIKELLGGTEGIVRMITVAPEVCSKTAIELMLSYGTVICAGHSNATCLEALTGFNYGIRSVTHLFNAMSPMHHRDPGLPGAAFMSDTALASVIADGIHVDYNAIAIAKKIMGERLFLVSDAVEENLSGEYMHIRRPDRFVLEDGTLSGSALTMLMAVKNCVEKAGIQPEEAIRMGTLYPARLMGFNETGLIKEGCLADLAVFDDDYNIVKVFKEGEPVE